MQMAKIGIHGIIASSKTTMVEIMERLGFSVCYELFLKNPYLEEYYRLMGMKNNSSEWSNIRSNQKELDSVALKTQLRFLHDRVFQYAEEPEKDVCDSSIYGDAAFAEVQTKIGIMSQDTYDNVYMPDNQLALFKIKPMRLYVWLYCDPQWALEQVRKRGRGMEQGITLEYLNLLHGAYEKIYDEFRGILHSARGNGLYDKPKSCPEMIYKMDTTGKEYWNYETKTVGKDYHEISDTIIKVALAVFKRQENYTCGVHGTLIGTMNTLDIGTTTAGTLVTSGVRFK